MKKRFFNFKSLFLVSFLAVAGIFSATAINDNNKGDSNDYIEAKADWYPPSIQIYGDLDSDSRTFYDPTSSSNPGQWNAQYNFTPIYVKAGARFSVLYLQQDWYNNYVGLGGGSSSLFQTESTTSGDVIYKSGNAARYYNIYVMKPRDWGGAGKRGVDINIELPSGYYTVERRYSLNGVDQGPDTTPHQCISSGGSVSAPESRSGYTFTGWYTAADGGTKVTSITSHQTVYAQYRGKPTVTKYAVLAGVKQDTPIGSDTIDYGSEYAVPAKIYEENYVFEGWYTDEECETEYTATTITSNTPLYGKYTYHGPWAGSIKIDLGSSGWAAAAANYAIYLFDSSYPEEGRPNGWTNYLSGPAANYKLVETFSYSVGFEPDKMIVIRYNRATSEATWKSNKWANIWSRTCDITYSTFAKINYVESGENTAISPLEVHLEGQKSGKPWGSIDFLFTDYKLNTKDTDHNVEFYKVYTHLESGSEFKMKCGTVYCATFTKAEGVGNAITGDGTNNLQVNTTGDYAFYYDTSTNSFYISTPTIIATSWGNAFLSGMKCDGDGNITKNTWSTLSTSYSALDPDVKEVYTTISVGNPTGTVPEQAVARYDYIIRKYGTSSFPDFIGRISAGVLTVGAVNEISPFKLIIDEGGNLSTIIIIIASSVALLSITTLSVLMVRKRKRKED